MLDLADIYAIFSDEQDTEVRAAAKRLVFKPQRRKPRPVPAHSELAAIIKTRGDGGVADDSVFPDWPAKTKAASRSESGPSKRPTPSRPTCNNLLVMNIKRQIATRLSDVKAAT